MSSSRPSGPNLRQRSTASSAGSASIGKDKYNGYASKQEMQAMQQAMAKNELTTEMAKKAAELAVEIVDVANETSVELVRQHQQLQVVEEKQEQMKEDIKVSEHAATYVKRKGCFSWLFACCCSCDCHEEENMKTRKQQLEARDIQQKVHDAERKLELAEKKAALKAGGAASLTSVSAVATADQHPPATTVEEGQRQELVGKEAMAAAHVQSTSTIHVPELIPETDRKVMQQQFDEQDQALDLISQAMNQLQTQANDWNVLLSEQVEQLQKIENNAEDNENRMAKLKKTLSKA